LRLREKLPLISTTDVPLVGDTWLARVEFPGEIRDDPAFMINPNVLFAAFYESMAFRKPVRIVSRLEIIIQVDDQPGPRWRRHYELPWHGQPNAPVATQLLHLCAHSGCRALILYPYWTLCAKCLARDTQRT
jgi:hypothetical protein